ncbi:hypothetical protein [Herbaspirillum huttiense]|uniref:hypothetical protein n=1 Tax=Herbaspirillum huttiense TaxID=863372 RepID=UPI0018E26F2F|nr:hypothetical protein [Herbaspirillum huttiense]
MTTINFKNIRSTPTSQRDSFEAMSVQLFRKCTNVPNNSSFISLRGDGGDGGVEAYFRTPAGTVIGVQAKYFFKLDAPELAQIADSLSTALSNHPALVEYHIYLPFDLTGRSGAGKRGKSQAERFEEWKDMVESAAAASGQSLRVVLLAAASIQIQLQEIDKYGGMRRYWFDETTISTHQIEQLLQQAIEFAGPRYTADLDIETHAHPVLDIFSGIGDYRTWADESLSPYISKLRSTHGYGTESFKILPASDKTKVTALLDELLAVLNGLEYKSSDDLSSRALDLLEQLAPQLNEVRSLQELAFYKEHGPNADTPGFRQFHSEINVSFPAQGMDSAREYERICNEIQHVLTSGEYRASTVSSLLLTGSASIGKTHAIISAASRRVKRGGMSLVVFGENFDGKEPWEVLRSKLGYGSNVGQDELFETLQSSADHTGLPFVIFIDASNLFSRE